MIAEDEATVAEVVQKYLERDGYEVRHTPDGAEVVPIVQIFQPNLVVLDVMLPHRDGRDICRDLRAMGGVSIIMLTARGEEMDKIVGLSLGADDYVTKPFSPAELMARVAAVLRRVPSAAVASEQSVVRVADLTIDTATRRVARAGQALELTAREFDLLAHMAAQPNRVFTRDQLLRAVWGYDAAGDDSTVTVHVRRLREKLEVNPAQPRYITTVWGVGYRCEG